MMKKEKKKEKKGFFPFFSLEAEFSDNTRNNFFSNVNLFSTFDLWLLPSSTNLGWSKCCQIT
jgi:hypothetical protein